MARSHSFQLILLALFMLAFMSAAHGAILVSPFDHTVFTVFFCLHLPASLVSECSLVISLQLGAQPLTHDPTVGLVRAVSLDVAQLSCI